MDLTGLGSIADLAGGILNRFWPKDMEPAQKAAVQIQLQQMLQDRETAITEAQRAVMVAEMQQSDPYTKRARPTLVYAGLFFVFLVHVVIPGAAWLAAILGRPIPEALPALKLPTEFWWAWSGVCGVWVFGRTMEKTGKAGKLLNMVTGGK